MSAKEKMMIKVIYFDEASATDFIYVLAGGMHTKKKEYIVTKTTKLASEVKAAIKKSISLFSIISAKLGIGANVNFSRDGNTIITKAIENTILTDYLEHTTSTGKPYIHVFSDCKPYPYPNSFAYFKMLTPYLKMTNGQIDVADGLSLNLSIMDETLDSCRGYYELMTEYDGETVVLRFNIKAFRNNYCIADLVKMNLDYHAIEVGMVNIGSLTMESEFGAKGEYEFNGFDLVDKTDKNFDLIKVYDVILAGVCR
ncbi:DUF6414 family protein [uncultured Phascolarctobacterium sp.]|uniref:DUF6414 family protein n=1 Tax=uncultured Phascolarctobacterium sp. TaxID=512296 RepID=UPI002588C0EB|nr:DUF6414 family protein [uncultured Phascolarctobacterium sp.]